MPIADEDRTAAATLKADYNRITECLKESAGITNDMLREMCRLREERVRLLHRIEVLETANRELRAWRNVAEKIKVALDREEIENAESVSTDGPVPQDRGSGV